MPSRPIPVDRLTNLQDHPDRGLTTAEAVERRARFGANDVVIAPPSTWTRLVRDTARDPMIWFLVGVAALFTAIGDYTEAAVLAVAIVPLAGMDAWLHRRTQVSTQGLATRLAAQATVLRNGRVSTVPAREVVPGDLVEVMPGEAFPADGLVVSGARLQAEESSLTGEAWPVRKQPLTKIPATPIRCDAEHWAFAGTRLLAGKARIRIAYTGAETFYGEIARSAQSGRQARTPLQIAVARLVSVTLAAALAMCVVLAAIRLFQGYGAVDALVGAATLAVAAIPEEFPVVFTFFLGVGVFRLARRQALVRRAVAVENIGRVTCICADKTGTMTEGRLVLAHAVPAENTSQEELIHAAALAAREESGDPLDAALNEAAAAPSGPSAERAAVFPFTEERRRETTFAALADGSFLAAVKGAPEVVLAMCGGSVLTPERIEAQVAAYASTGHKVIAVAVRKLGPSWPLNTEPEDGFTLSGLLAFEDPIREGVPGAVAACRQAGIRVIMVTGDHPVTAEAIAREAGLGGGKPRVVLAETLTSGTEAVSAQAFHDVDVLARASPPQKEGLVQALRNANEVVAVTGDGVNDVPALQHADIGIAMGERGTQSAREAAAVVLLDDNFRTIVRAIAEGRQLFRNLQLAFAYLLMVHIPLVVSAAAVPLANNPLLYLPIHIVWLELIIHPTALLVFQELPSSDRLSTAHRTGHARFFNRRTWAVIFVSGFLLSVMIFFGFENALGETGDVEHARSMAIGALVAASIAITAALSGLRTWAARLTAGGSLVSLLLFIQIPALAELAHLEPLHLPDWGLAAATGIVAGILALLARLFMREKHR